MQCLLLLIFFSANPVFAQWLSHDIGNVGAVGSFTENAGVFTVQGSGADIWYQADAFRYVYREISGDFMLTARVVKMQNTAPWAKAGVMIRETLADDSKCVHCFMSPSGICNQFRMEEGGNVDRAANEVTGFAPPCWIRLSRKGDLFTAYHSSDGFQWIQIAYCNIQMNADVYAGLIVCSVNDGVLCQAQFDNVSIVANGSEGHNEYQTGMQQWNAKDIGDVGVAGSFRQNNGVFSIGGAGSDVWGRADGFRYVFKGIDGDFKLTARVLSMDHTAPWAKAGVMIRDTLEADSGYFYCYLSPEHGIAFQLRPDAGKDAISFIEAGNIDAPCWVQLQRVGNSISAHASQDGVEWRFLGSLDIPKAQNIYAGLAVCSMVDDTICQAQFDNVDVIPIQAIAGTAGEVYGDTKPPISETNQTEVAQASTPSKRLFIFYKPGNLKCDQFTIELENSQLAEKFPETKIEWIDVDQNPAMAKKYNPFIVPTAVIQLHDGSTESFVCYGQKAEAFMKWLGKYYTPVQ